jgi:mRNA-degrading endonuclease YafQ of YafQ-DinJ toxin-antitoxin module
LPAGVEAHFFVYSEIHAPYRTRKVRNEHCPWLNNEIKKISYHRDYLKKKAVRLNSTAYTEAYKRCKNQVTKLIRDAKAHDYKTNLEQCKNSKVAGDLLIIYSTGKRLQQQSTRSQLMDKQLLVAII